MSETAKLDTATRSHHPDSPSSLQASEACPCFENEQRESQASEDGVLCHKATETGDLTILDGNEEQERAVKRCLDYQQRVIDYFRSRGVEPLIIREQYLSVGDDSVTDINGKKWEGVSGGFPDIVIYSLTLGEAHCLDWKFGKVPVTPTKDNVQGHSYELGIRKLLGPRIKLVTVHFFAPNQGWTEQEQEEKYIHTFGPEDAPARELRIRTIIARKKSSTAKPCPKVDLCIWCAKKGGCEANWKAIIPLGGKYEDLVAPDVVPPHKLSLPSQFAAAIKFAGQVELWAKAVKARCADVVRSEGIDIPGFKLVSASRRSVVSVKAFAEVAQKNGVTPEEFFETLSVAFDPVEKLIKQKAAKGKGAAAIRQFTSDLEETGAVQKGSPYYFLKESRSPADSQEIINV